MGSNALDPKIVMSDSFAINSTAVTVGNTGTETAILGVRVPVNGPVQAYHKLDFSVPMTVSTKSSSPGNLTLKVYLGTTVVKTLTLSPTTSLSTSAALLRGTINFLTANTSTGVLGTVSCWAVVGATDATMQITDTSMTAVNLDSTVIQQFSASATWATSDVANILVFNDVENTLR